MKLASLLLNMNTSTKALDTDIIIIANLYTCTHTHGSRIHVKTWVVWITPPCWNRGSPCNKAIHQLS